MRSRYNGPLNILFAQAEQSSVRTPERDLIAAVLSRALCDLLGPERVHQRGAEAWMLDDSVEAWSFRWVCEALDLEPFELRRRALDQSSDLGRIVDKLLMKRGRRATETARISGQNSWLTNSLERH